MFSFLAVERDYSNGVHWEDSNCEKLWIYNLHYFDYLNSRTLLEAPDIAQDLIHRWVNENPPGLGNGWEPYPNSLRIVNWIKWAIYSGRPSHTLLHSLSVQVRWLSRTVEHQILANHLFANAKALVFAGLYFSGAEADSWLKHGIALVNAELEEQVLADGAHYERSPMYHAIILEDVLDLVNLAAATDRSDETRPSDQPGESTASVACLSAATRERWHDKAREMLSWYASMVHSDGRLSFFNDAAMEIAPTLEALRQYAKRLGVNARIEPSDERSSYILEPSGYAVLQAGQMRVIADVAPVGPDYQPGHTHADTLSFELSVAGERVLVNSGTSTYKIGEQRQYERSTRAHNTVEIDGKNSSEVWAGFRVARRAYPMDVELQITGQATTLRAAHDGYHRLRPPVTHRRSWELNDVRLEVTDSLEGRWSNAIGRLYLHPDMLLGHDRTIITGSGVVLHWEVSGAKPSINATMWYHEFGNCKKNQCIEYVFEASSVTFTLSLPS